MESVKVFGIGAHKTGTTSLKNALEILGYKVCGEFGIDNPNIANEAMDIARTLVPQYDAFQDNPWPVLYRQLDRAYPGSKFILTLRDRDKWLKSIQTHFGNTDTEMRKWIYGVGHPIGNEEVYLNRYDEHNHSVQEYFKDRPEDFLVLRLTEGDGWEPLCQFLGKKLPEMEAIPHKNKGAKENRGLNKLKKRLTRLIRK